jgi:cold shock CspA family protein
MIVLPLKQQGIPVGSRLMISEVVSAGRARHLSKLMHPFLHPAIPYRAQELGQICDRPTAHRSTRPIGHHLFRDTRVDRSRFSSFGASGLRRRQLSATVPSSRNPTPVQRTPVRGTLRSSRPSGRQVVQPRKGIWIRRTIRWVRRSFLHGSVLAQRGIDAVQPGDTLEARVGPGHKGPHITEVLSVGSGTAAPVAPKRSSFRETSGGPSSDTSVEEVGTVKWFNAEKGFGFIARDSGGKDVFVHISALERSGITSLGEGQQVIVDVAEGRKWPEATRIRLV